MGISHNWCNAEEFMPGVVNKAWSGVLGLRRKGRLNIGFAMLDLTSRHNDDHDIPTRAWQTKGKMAIGASTTTITDASLVAMCAPALWSASAATFGGVAIGVGAGSQGGSPVLRSAGRGYRNPMSASTLKVDSWGLTQGSAMNRM